jgi:hypothetical protein
MTFEEFERSLGAATPPDGLSAPLTALWHDGRGDWDRAHTVAQDVDDATGAWVHAYLHRKEGDRSNAGYWYRHARRPPASGDLNQEWRAIVQALLGEK